MAGAARRAGPPVAVLAACLATAVTSLFQPRPRLLWNVSPSSPTGLYLVSGARDVARGDMVVAWPPPEARRLAASRGYLPLHVPLVKGVAALAGDRVCAAGARLSVDGRLAAVRRLRDARGRRLPWWSGCRTLGAGDLLLLTPANPDAFDGRYFGPTRRSQLIGRARLVWPS